MSNPRDMSSLQSVQSDQPAQSEWRDWLRAHGPKLLLFARQQSRSQEDAEDILQDAVVKLVNKVRKGEFVGGSESAGARCPLSTLGTGIGILVIAPQRSYLGK